MKILKTIKQTQTLISKLRAEGKVIGFVPTMGYLHEGHLSLIRAARRKADYVIVSIYVNPLQFAPNEDLTKYPRDFKRDEKLCKREGVDCIFYPDDNEMYPEGFSTYVNVESISAGLEGSIRPEHFRGVATIVLKFFNIVQPHFSVFGQKDAQQAAVIKKMTLDLNLNTKIIISPTVREQDGLAMSSRNVYLSPEQRTDAANLYKALQFAKSELSLDSSNKDIDHLKEQMNKLIISGTSVTKIDYISFNDSTTLEELKILKNTEKSDILISLAVRFGNVRLIDNIVIKR